MNIRKINKKILSFVCIALLILGFSVFRIKADDNGTFDSTYTIDSNGELVPTQHAYLHNGTISSFTVTNSEIQNLSAPEDFYYQEELDKYYIADTGNKRVLVCDSKLDTAISLGEGILKNPTGVFATSDGDVYVTDSTLGKVIIFSTEIREYGKPNHPLYGENIEFKPVKIAVDSNKTMYIIDAGNANGVVQITNEGSFSGYFGANYTTPDLKYIIKFMLYSKEQRAKLYFSPIAPTNLTFDYDGLLVTVTSGLSEGEGPLKRLNIAGNNMLPLDMFSSNKYADVCIGPTGVIIAVDSNGYINEFDKEGNLLFTFGGKDTSGKINGLFSSPKSIEMNSDYTLFVLDKDTIHVFNQTEFASLVHQALDLYNEGKYEESHEPWQKVLALNNMFDLAHSGLGKAYLREMDYKNAMKEFKIAKDVSGYSKAYWEVRNDWIMSYTEVILISLLALGIVFIVIKKTKLKEVFAGTFLNVKKKVLSVKIIDECFYLFKFIKKPLNGFYELKYHKKMSVLSATIWYIVLFIIIILSNTCIGFIYNTDDVATISVLRIFSLSVLPILLFVITNYLVSSITIGNGRLKDVYIGTICSFAPVIVFLPFAIIISNFLTLNESFIYTMLTVIIWGWSFILLYFMIKDIQELQVGENNKNIFLTILTMLLFVALIFLLYILSSQLFTFIKDIVLEVLSNA